MKTQKELIETVVRTIEIEAGPHEKYPVLITSIELDGVDVTDYFSSESVILCPKQN